MYWCYLSSIRFDLIWSELQSTHIYSLSLHRNCRFLTIRFVYHWKILLIACIWVCNVGMQFVFFFYFIYRFPLVQFISLIFFMYIDSISTYDVCISKSSTWTTSLFWSLDRGETFCGTLFSWYGKQWIVTCVEMKRMYYELKKSKAEKALKRGAKKIDGDKRQSLKIVHREI